MHRKLSRTFGAVAAVLLLGVAAHAQSSINDCEKIQAADAYNQCLAKFGPAEKAQNLQPERPADIKSNSEEAAATAGSGRGRHAAAAAHRGGRSRRGHVAHRRSGGRKRLVISVGHRRHR